MDRLRGLLDAKKLPKGGPKGSQMELKRRLAQKTGNSAKTLISIELSTVFVDF